MSGAPVITRLIQTRVHSETTQGNCWEACIHSLLGDDEIILDLQDSNSDSWDNHWLIRTTNYLATRGWAVITCEDQASVYITNPDLIHIATGPSPRGSFQHAVLYKDGSLWHDPHPSGAGLVAIKGVAFLVPLQ